MTLILHRVKSLLTWDRRGASEGSLHLRGRPPPSYTPTAPVVHGRPADTLRTLELAVEGAKKAGGVSCGVSSGSVTLTEESIGGNKHILECARCTHARPAAISHSNDRNTPTSHETH